MSQPDITELAARIASNTAKVNKYYIDRNLPLPSFDHNGPTKSLIKPEDADIEVARQAVIFDCSELRILLQGPSEYVAGLGFYVSRKLRDTAVKTGKGESTARNTKLTRFGNFRPLNS